MPIIVALIAVLFIGTLQGFGQIDKPLAALLMCGTVFMAVFAVIWESIGQPNSRRMAPGWREPPGRHPAPRTLSASARATPLQLGPGHSREGRHGAGQ